MSRRSVPLGDLAEEVERGPQSPTRNRRRRRERPVVQEYIARRAPVTPIARLCSAIRCLQYGHALARPGGYSCVECAAKLEELSRRIIAEHAADRTARRRPNTSKEGTP